MRFLVAFFASAVQGTATKRRTQLLNLNSTARLKQLNMALWPSGKAKVCNTSIPGSIPGGASKQKSTAKAVLFCLEVLPHKAPPGSTSAGEVESGSQHSPKAKFRVCFRSPRWTRKHHCGIMFALQKQCSFVWKCYRTKRHPAPCACARNPVRISARRASGSLLTSGEGEIYSPKAKFRKSTQKGAFPLCELSFFG